MKAVKWPSKINHRVRLGVICSMLLVGCDGTSQTDISAQSGMTSASAPVSRPAVKVVSPDWGVAATLAAMGHAPIATGDVRLWEQWVGKPALPASTKDLGTRYQPNAELVAQLPVDVLVDNDFYAHARSLYGRDVRTETVKFASHDATAVWEDYAKPTRKLGQLINQPLMADKYIANSHAEIEQAGKRLRQRHPNVEKFAVVQFIDDNNLRMYTANSLFNVALTQMNRELVALGEGNDWGFISLQLGDLARLAPDVCLLIIEPLSPITEAQLADSLVWQRLGFGQKAATGNLAKPASSRCMTRLPTIWIYGGMASLTGFADNLAAADLIGGAAL